MQPRLSHSARVQRAERARAFREKRRALHASRLHYRAILDSSIDLICRFTPDLRISFANDAYCTFFGHPRHELIGTSLLEHVPPDQHEVVRARVQQVIGDPLPTVGINTNMTAQGLMVWVEWVNRGIRDRMGRVIEIQAIGRDVTRQKEAEFRLHQSEATFSAMIEAATEGIVLIDDKGRILLVNNYVEKVFGFPRDRLIGQTIEVLIPVAARHAHVRYRHIYNANPEPRMMGMGRELSGQRADGAVFPVEVSITPVDVHERHLLMCFIVDISVRKQLESQNVRTLALEKDLEREREINDLNLRYASMLSHQFRTPLTVIQSSGGIIRYYQNQLSPEKLAEHAERIVAQVKRMINLLDEVLLLSTARAHKLEFMPGPLDLESYLQALLENHRLADNGKHRLVSDLTAIDGLFLLDESLLENIFSNLVGNALKYSPPDSTVTLGCIREDGVFRFVVRDQGIGIPIEDQVQLFQPFFRARNARIFEGTGLGLAITHGSVLRHNGSITVDSAPGAGTNFYVVLPCVPVEPGETKPEEEGTRRA